MSSNLRKMEFKSIESVVKERVDKLRELSRQHTGSVLSVELRSLLSELKSSVLRHTSPTHAFCILGGPRILLQFLSQGACAGQDAVLLLGLLGNLCALDKSSRDIVMVEHKKIVRILCDTTQCEVLNTSARLVANLALDHTNIVPLLADGVVHSLVQSLTRGTNSCKRSILRALRLLAVNSDCRDEVSSVDGVGVVAECLQSCDSHVSSTAVLTLQALTKDGENVSALCNKLTLQLIIRHCHHSESSVCEGAVKVLLSTAKCSDGRVAISNAGGIETLVGLMERYGHERSVLHEVVCALCMCCSDVISRQRLRDSGGLHKLITMLTCDDHLSLHGNILSALICYYFDEVSLKAMVKTMGLLNALVYHLKRESVVTVSSEEDSADTATERSVSPLDSEVDFGPSSPTITPVGVVTAQPHPQATTQRAPLVHLEELDPMTQPPPSKRSRLEVDFDSLTPVPPNFLDSLLSSPSPYSTEERVYQTTPLPPPLQYQVIQLLSRVSHLKDCLPLLSASDILSPIIQVFTSTASPDPHVFKILFRVFSNPHCFQDTLLSFAPSTLQPCLCLYSGEEKAVRQCGELMDLLSKIAESPYGQGVLAHMLLRGHDKEKHACCLSLPMLCSYKSVRVCKTLMLTHGGFHQLSLLARTEGDLQTLALDSLLQLTLYTIRPVGLSRTQTAVRTVCRYIDSDHLPFDLVLVVHGGGECGRVPVHRQVMVESSEVFAVMLEGEYKEGHQKEVVLRELPPLCLMAVVHHLYGCGWECEQVHTLTTTHTAEDEVPEGLNVVESITSCISDDRKMAATLCLNVIICAGRFLLTDLSTLCQHAAVQYVLPSNIVEMLYFATMHECYCLSESCIRVVKAMSGELQREVFRDLVTSYVGETVLSMLRMFLSVA